MDFLGMGMGEILLVILVALIIWGPGKLPEIARTVSKAVHTLRQTTSDITSQITKELDETEEGKRDHLPPSEDNSSQKTTVLEPPSVVESAAKSPDSLPPVTPKSENTGED